MHELRGQDKRKRKGGRLHTKTDTVHLVQGLISFSFFSFFLFFFFVVVLVNWFSCVSAQSETINAFVTISYGHFAWDCFFFQFFSCCEDRQ